MRKQVLLWMLCVLCAANTCTAFTWHVSTNSLSDGPGTAWSNAFWTIQEAVDVAMDGDTVLVTNGVYDTGGAVTPEQVNSNRVVLTKSITLRSVNGQDATYIVGAPDPVTLGPGSNAVRGVYFTTNAVLIGFTITNGNAGHVQSGGGVFCAGTGSVVSNCTISGNAAFYYGGGSYGGTLYNCTISGNRSDVYGGGSYEGTLHNCTIAGNSTLGHGGGSYESALYNCTITDNEASHLGGGIFACTVRNSIVWHNTADPWAPDVFSSSLQYSCSPAAVHGEDGNITNAPIMLSSSHIATNSPCLEAGINSFSGGTDIDGEAWLNPPSMGCDEYHGAGSMTGTLSVALSGPTNLVVGCDVDYVAHIVGKLYGNSWDFGDGTVITNEVYPTHTWSTPGDYDVILSAYSDSYPGGLSATLQVHVASVEDSTIYVSASEGNDAENGLTWTNAKQTLQGGVDAQHVLGGLVLVTNGIYELGGATTPGELLSNRVVIAERIRVESVNGPDVTVIKGAADPGTLSHGTNAMRCAYVSQRAYLSGFTLTNGHTQVEEFSGNNERGGGALLESGGTLSECVLSGNSAADSGGGVWATDAGVLHNCVISGNSAKHDGGGAGGYGTLNNCTITGNSADYQGGGNYRGTLYNCVLSGNFAGQNGGGTRGGTLNNCTLSGNISGERGGGSYDSYLNNCIVWHNRAYDSDPDVAVSTLQHSCSPGAIHGENGNITNAPIMLSTSHMATNSPCRGAGLNSFSSGTDIDGEAWLNPPSMGCDEYHGAGSMTGTLSVALSGPTNLVVGYDVEYVAYGVGGFYGNSWDFDDGTVVTNEAYPTHTWSTAGDYDVVLSAYSDSYPGGQSATLQVHVASVADSTIYVSATEGNDVADGQAWTNAKQTLQGGVDAQHVLGGLVLVTNGVYELGGATMPGELLSNRVVITKPIRVESVNGRDVTVIKGAADPTTLSHGTSAVRCAYLTPGASLTGFTLTNGFTRFEGPWGERAGGAVQFHYDGMVSECILSGNSAENAGGGANCLVAGTLVDCIIRGNEAKVGGGVLGCTLNNCTISGNRSDINGGGSYRSVLNNCMLLNNSAGGRGGGSYSDTPSTTLNNCLISGNNADVSAGGCYGGSLSGCTVTGNSVSNRGGGVYFSRLTNCIVWYNTTVTGSNPNAYSYASSTYNSCSPDLSHGDSGNITNEPMFVELATTNLQLRHGSPCIDSGQNLGPVITNDIEGRARPIDGDGSSTDEYDMGAYEHDPWTFDTDSDGLSDGDEMTTYGTSPTNTNTDGDFFSDYEEMIADTDGADSNKYFQLTNIETASLFAVTFPCSTARVYSLQYTTNLPGGMWLTIPEASGIQGPGGVMSLTDTVDSVHRAYRVTVTRP